MLKRQRLDPASKRETNKHTRHLVENPEGQHCSHRKKSEVAFTLPKPQLRSLFDWFKMIDQSQFNLPSKGNDKSTMKGEKVIWSCMIYTQ